MKLKQCLAGILALLYCLFGFIHPVLCQEDNTEALLAKAMSLRKAKKYDEALAVYNEICTKSPYNAIAFQEKGAVLASLNKYKDAIAAENRAIRLNPKLHLAHIYKGMIYCNKKRNLDAYTEFEKALAIKPESYVVHMRMGLVSNQLKRLDKAHSMYSKASQLKPKRSAPHMALSAVYIKQGEIDRAIDEAKIAIKLEPNAINYQNLGAIYAIINKLKEANELLSKSIELNPKFTEAYINLGRVQTLQGDYDKAIESYKKAREISPRNRTAFNALMQLNNKSILRVKVTDSKTNWHVTKYGCKPQVTLTLKNMSGEDLSNKTIFLKARVENLKKGTIASAQTKVKQKFEPDDSIEVNLTSRAKFKIPETKQEQSDFQCTVKCRVGNVSSYDAQYILDRLMIKPKIVESSSASETKPAPPSVKSTESE